MADLVMPVGLAGVVGLAEVRVRGSGVECTVVRTGEGSAARDGREQDAEQQQDNGQRRHEPML
nr:hypothetical protein [Azospirillum brasilense]